jgi:hypothetical protein
MPVEPIRVGHSLPPVVEFEVSAAPAETKPEPTAESSAPLASTSANEGKVFTPELGDDVLVAFERGDPRAPSLTGGLWNANTPPTDAGPGAGHEDKRFSEERAEFLNHQLKNLK